MVGLGLTKVLHMLYSLQHSYKQMLHFVIQSSGSQIKRITKRKATEDVNTLGGKKIKKLNLLYQEKVNKI